MTHRRIPPREPVVGCATARSTGPSRDRLHQSLMVMTRGNAGFLTGKSGREIVFGTYVMYVPMKTIEDIFTVLGDVGSDVEAIYETD